MITYVDREHALDYQDLFRDAEDVLLHNSDFKAELLESVEDVDLRAFLLLDETAFEAALQEKFDNNESIIITTLNDYFAFLPALLNILSTIEDEKLALTRDKFVRLPLAEPFVEINAETRAVAIPSDFAKNGVGVQGDTYAETLYFAIDRFYDIADLASDDLNIIIQWEFKNADGEMKQGISKNSTKEVIAIDGKQKVVFGWVITDDLTKTATNVRFAVRFYSLDERRNLKYSFSSLPAEVSIKSTLITDYETTAPVEDNVRAEVIRRLTSSKVYDNNYASPGDPEFTTDLTVQGQINDPAIGVDLVDGHLTLYAAGERVGGEGGRLDYAWNYYPSADNGSFEPTPDHSFDPDEHFIYVQLADDEEPNDQVKYYADNQGVESYDRGTVKLEDGHFIDTTTGLTISAPYKKVNSIVIDQAGIYTVDLISSNIYNNKKTLEMAAADGVHVPGPKAAKVELPEDTYSNITIEDDKPLVHLTSADAEEGKINLEISASNEGRPDVISYKWIKKNGELIVPIEDSNNDSYEVTLPDSDNFDDIYSVIITTTRNGVPVTNSYPAVYRITNVPAAPVFAAPYNEVHLQKYSSKKVGPTRFRTISIEASLDGINTDLDAQTPLYVWMFKRIADDAEIDELDANTVEVNIEGPSHDVILNPEVAQFDSENKIVFTENAEALNSNRYQLKETDEGGLYYCVAFNKLNNNYTAAVCGYKYTFDND